MIDPEERRQLGEYFDLTLERFKHEPHRYESISSYNQRRIEEHPIQVLLGLAIFLILMPFYGLKDAITERL